MHQFAPEALRTLDRLNAGFRFVTRAATLKAKERKDDPDIIVEPAGTYCEIIDKTIGGEPYCSAIGENEADALRNAAIKAITAPKPKTPAQLAGEALLVEARGDANAALTKASTLEIQNSDLLAKMAQMQARMEQFAGILQAQGKIPVPDADHDGDSDAPAVAAVTKAKTGR